MPDRPPAAVALDELGVPYGLFVHSEAVHSLEAAAEQRGQQPQQVVRTLLFRLAADEYALVLVAGPRQIPWKALRRHFGRSRLTLADADEVLALTGYAVGAVSPWGLPAPIPTFIEQAVFAQEQLSIGSGRHGAAILITAANLQRPCPKPNP